MRKFTVSAPGKLHLLGEHSVVYGKPAIIAAVNKRCYAIITEQKTNEVTIELENGVITITQNEILEKTKNGREIWKEYTRTNDIGKLNTFTSNPFDFIAIAIGESLLFYKKKSSSGFSIKIHSDIPIGSGMGSSSALAVAVAGAVSLFLGEKLNKEKINEIAFRTEQKKHGMPSGGDNSASCYGGFILYKKKSDREKIIIPLPYSFPKSLADKFVAIQTGIPIESTGEMVALVKNEMLKSKSKFISIFNEQENLVEKLAAIIKERDGKKIMDIIKKGENNLEKIGVVSESTKKIIREIEKSGGAAKICGAGGRKKSSGIVLAFHENKKKLESILKTLHAAFFSLQLGAEGIKQE